MPRECDCAGGKCKPSGDVSRREFITIVGAAGVLSTAGAAVADEPQGEGLNRYRAPGAELAKWEADLMGAGRPRIYRSGVHTDARMHLGGIGTGNFEIGSDGRLTTWQLFNTLRDGETPFYFAVRAGKTAKLLQTVGGPDVPRIKSIEMRGEYPVALLKFIDPDLRVEMELEAFSPFAPLETRASSMPAAFFVFRLKNTSASRQEVSLAAFMQNPVGYEADGVPEGVRHPQYGGNVNEVRLVGRATVLSMSARVGKLPTLNQPIRLYTNIDNGALNSPFNDRPSQLTIAPLPQVAQAAEGAGARIAWIEDAPADMSAATLRAVRDAAEAGAEVVFAGRDVPLLKAFAFATQGKEIDASAVRPTIRFDDFEGGYDNWTVEGEAFGSKPASGTLPNQQRVSGFVGKALVNSFLGGDVPTGKMTSKPFTIDRRYIRFLVGGGSHPSTQIRLMVDGKAVRAASGRDEERLLPVAWDVSDLMGKEARLVIVDEASGGWGHINVDEIEFTDLPGDIEALKLLGEMLPARFSGVQASSPDPVTGVTLTTYAACTVLPGASERRLANGARVISRKLGKGSVHLLMAALLPQGQAGVTKVRQKAYSALAELVGARYEAPDGLHPLAPGAGRLELAALKPGSSALRAFVDWKAAWASFAAKGAFAGGTQASSAPSPTGATVAGAVASTVTVEPGKTVEVPFALTWHYPNAYTRQGVPMGTHYTREWATIRAVTDEAVRDYAALRRLTGLFRRTMYDSTLPYWLLDCLTSQAATIRHIGIVFRIANGHIFGWEGSNGCCQPTCTHVWGYEQSLARLFPDLARLMREVDYKHQQRPDGGINNRTEVPSPMRPTGEQPFADGHASCVLKAYREALLCADDAWMREYWPYVKKAVEYLIGRDAATNGGTPDGVLRDDQWNTYDEALHGVTTFISVYYLAALRAGEEWARRMGDAAAATRFRSIRERGAARLEELCWDGEYYAQHLPGCERMPGEVGPGCMADQMIGQWWAHQLGLGYLLPEARVKSALAAVYKHNFLTDLTGWPHSPRAFAGAKDKGLMIVTWPKGGRPPHVMLYSDEVWTGIEYQVAGHLIHEGMLKEGLAIIKGARDRYDGIPRPPIPRNPWNEIECGGHYARAMSSWSALLAVSGFAYDGLAASMGFAPRMTPERFRSFFCAAEGWGTLAQTRKGRVQTDTITVAHGRLKLARLQLEGAQPPTSVDVRAKGASIGVKVEMDGPRVTLTFATPIVIEPGAPLTITLR